ncbi:MAG: hypothetical protein ABSC64_02355 [Candidatus Korobacteraceae bacterium]
MVEAQNVFLICTNEDLAELLIDIIQRLEKLESWAEKHEKAAKNVRASVAVLKSRVDRISEELRSEYNVL